MSKFIVPTDTDYFNVAFHICLTIILPAILLVLSLIPNLFWSAIGYVGLGLLVLKGSFTITKGLILVSDRDNG